MRMDEELQLPARSGEKSCRLIAVGLRRCDSGTSTCAFKAVRSCVRVEGHELSLVTEWSRLRETGSLAESCATIVFEPDEQRSDWEWHKTFEECCFETKQR
jgi:hypothetical protein